MRLLPKNNLHAMEILWICMGILCLVVGINRTVNLGFGEAWPMFGFAAACALFYLWRRSLRKKDQDNDGKKMQ